MDVSEVVPKGVEQAGDVVPEANGEGDDAQIASAGGWSLDELPEDQLLWLGRS